MEKKHYILVLCLVFIVIFTNFFFVFQNNNFNYEAYFDLRQATSVKERGRVIYDDELSFNGRENVFLPFFYYVLGFLSLFFPLFLVSKLLVGLLLGLLVIIIFLISREIITSKRASLLSALVAGFVPAAHYFIFSSGKTLFSLLLIFLSIYFFLKIKEKKYLFLFLVTIMVLSLTSTLGWLLIIGFLFYLALASLESFKVNKSELELIIFSVLFFFWIQFVFFKEALLKHGLYVLWGNKPAYFLTYSLGGADIVLSILSLSLIPLGCGVFLIYNHLFRKENKKLSFLISFVLVGFLFLWFKLVNLNAGLLFLGFMLSILFGIFYNSLMNYIDRTKLSDWKGLFFGLTIVLILGSSFVPFVVLADKEVEDIVQEEEREDYLWLKENTKNGSIILASVKEGFLINFLSERRNVWDENFFLIEDVNEIAREVEEIYTSRSLTKVVKLLNKYEVDYIVFSSKVEERYNIREPIFKELDCIEEVKEDIYEDNCKIVVSEK